MCRKVATNIFLTFWGRKMSCPPARAGGQLIYKLFYLKIWNSHPLLYLCSVLVK